MSGLRAFFQCFYASCFSVLRKKKRTHKQVKHVKYNTFEIARYLKEGDVKLSEKERQYLFHM